jgi:hypothetical protein
LTLITDEKEGPVSAIPDAAATFSEAGQNNWATGRSAKLMALQQVARKAIPLVEKRIGVERVVSHEVEHTAGHNADDATAIAAVFRRVVAGKDAKLRDCVRIWIEDYAVAE